MFYYSRYNMFKKCWEIFEYIMELECNRLVKSNIKTEARAKKYCLEFWENYEKLKGLIN